jgi:phospholipid-binding lipoprotein MlaA
MLWRAIAVVVVWCALGPAVAAGEASDTSRNHDPWEAVNRKIFWFNDQLDIYVLEPVAKGWEAITTARIRQSVGNFFRNVREPVTAANDLLQGKPHAAAIDVARFLTNTTFGLVGFFDVAGDWGLSHHDEDFGQTLGVWGVPAGPYVMLPLLGPSNPRDVAGLVVDSAGAVYVFFVGIEVTMPPRVVDTVNARAQVLREVEQAKEAAVDYYVFVRNAYEQRREELVSDGAAMTKQEAEDLYTIEDNGGEP